MKKKLLKSVSKADFAVNCSASATGGEDFKQNYETEFRPMTLQEVAQFEDLRRPKLHKTEKILMTPYIEKFGLYNFVTFMHYDIYLSYVLCNFFLLQYSVSEENEKLDLYKEYIDYCFFMRSLRFLPDNIKEFLRQFEKRLSTFGSIVSSDRSFYCDDFMLPDTLIVTGYKKKEFSKDIMNFPGDFMSNEEFERHEKVCFERYKKHEMYYYWPESVPRPEMPDKTE